ncbi:hypothetical protein [Absidia glauca]|uniref:Kinesin-like protein n=1 Tax=Absidia glauca TaxID=4829 RepID=A0A163J231_ABSGL|nr:hypothetical protein [Absidia glauca]
MTTSAFLDTLRQHDLEQFYTAFYTHGINQLQSLAQLSVQDYAQLGITDLGDRRKIFGLIQLLRKEPTARLTTPLTTSTSTLSGIRQPHSYGDGGSRLSANTTDSEGSSGSTFPSSPLSHLASVNNRPLEPHGTSKSSRISRPRPLSIIGDTPSLNKSTLLLPGRTLRQRTMSDAGRLDLSSLPSRSTVTRDNRQRTNLRRPLCLQQDTVSKSILRGNSSSDNNDDDDDDDDSNSRKYRPSAPLLNTYGVPTVKTRASMGALKHFSNTPSTPIAAIPTATSSSTATPSYNLPPSDLNQKIRVCVRKRPLNRKEVDKGEKDISPCLGTRSLHINEPKLRLDMSRYIEQHSFTFDDVFNFDTPNVNVYQRTALPLVNYIFKGGKATCFAYGQTGSGKTFTMLDPKHGLYIMAANDIFSLLRQPEHQHLSAWIGLYEIYQGHLYDLLNNRKKLYAREDGKQNVVISGLKEYPIDNVDKLIQVFDYGNQIRTTGSTGANDSSSRSHAVLQVLLKPKKNKKKIHGKMSFIDLAGSERGADRGDADTKTRMEGAEINKSLLALKECIRALDQDKRHTPFRQSKLTQVLKDSFVGNSRTCMIATISPGGTNSEHTLNTLRYADRVKELKGDRDRRATAERDSQTNNQGDSTNDDVSMQDDSDILDEDTYNLDEENIFDVDFPHEQDELIRSNNVFSTPATPQKPLPRLTSSTFGNQQKRQEPTFRNGSSNRTKGMTRSSSGLPSNEGASSPSIHRSPSLTMDAMTNYNTSSSPILRQQQQQRQMARFSSTTTTMTYDDMDDFVKLHRAEIRAVADYTKQENKLVASVMRDLSSGDGNLRSYLESLDQVLEEKMAAIDALKDRINDTMLLIDS